MVPSLDELPMVVATIDTPEDELRERLVISVRREARLYQAGISCELKDNAEVTCLACPYSEAENPESKKSGLCRLSKSQDVLLTLLHAKRVGRPVGV